MNHEPSLASNVQTSGPKHSMKHAKYGGVWSSSINSVFPLTIFITCFNIDTALSNNKGTNIVIVGVVLLHVKQHSVINENLH